jgi:hypothetical protein
MEAISCYIVSDDCGGNFIVGYGVGVLREKIGECFSQKIRIPRERWWIISSRVSKWKY